MCKLDEDFGQALTVGGSGSPDSDQLSVVSSPPVFVVRSGVRAAGRRHPLRYCSSVTCSIQSTTFPSSFS